MASNEVITYKYVFAFDEDAPRSVEVRLDKANLQLQSEVDEAAAPQWTELTHSQCSNCPLKPEDSPRCPAAVSLVPVMKNFDQSIARKLVNVTVETVNRKYVKKTNLQEALGSLVGLLMVTSGCPVMAKLRPLALTHLPFATMDETNFRMLSMYLLAQFFVQKKTGEADWELKEFLTIHEEVRTVNQFFHERLASVGGQEGSPAALLILDLFSRSLSFSLEEGSLSEIKSVFEPYL